MGAEDDGGGGWWLRMMVEMMAEDDGSILTYTYCNILFLHHLVGVTFSDTNEPCIVEEASFGKYLKDRTFRYKNFADRDDREQSLNVNEFSWEGYGFSLVDRFYPEMGQLLDEKFKVCESFTYNT